MAPLKILPPRDLVRRLLDYDPMTGVFTWKPRPREMFAANNSFLIWNARFAGKAAGTIGQDRRRYILIWYSRFSAYRLAWLYVYGEPVPPLIDHADRDRLNDAIANLRAATYSENGANADKGRRNITGAKGVGREGERYRARIGFQGKEVYLGTFDTIEEAAVAYQEAAIRLYGEFARWKD